MRIGTPQQNLRTSRPSLFRLEMFNDIKGAVQEAIDAGRKASAVLGSAAGKDRSKRRLAIFWTLRVQSFLIQIDLTRSHASLYKVADG
jgi:hypothetical protein